MKTLFTSFGKMRLHSRVFLVCSIVLISALLCASIFISIPTMNVITEDYIQTSERDMALISKMTESTLSHLFNYSVSIASDSRIIQAAKQNPNGLGYDAKATQLRHSLGQSVRAIIGTNSDIYKYDMFTLDGTVFSVGGYTYPYGLDVQLSKEFFCEAASSLAPQIHGPYNIIHTHGSFPVYIITKSIIDLDTHQPYGVLLLLVRESRLSYYFANDTSNDSVSYFIVNDGLDVVSCTDSNLITKNIADIFDLDQPSVSTLLNQKKCITKHNSNNTLFMLSNIENNRVDWHILMTTSMRLAQTAWKQVYSNVLIIAAVSCIILLSISYMLSQSISRPIYRLVDSIHKDIKTESMQPLAIPEASQEVVTLYKTYNELNEHILTLLDHINREQEEKSNIKFKLIQAQIKPHFLYNTLMTIKSLIDLDMNETASECVYAMSSFYRLSLNKGNDILKLSDEIELSTQYMYIQKLRYIDRLDYVFDVPRSLYEYYVPKMTIQPILENAIYHGVKEKAEKGIIEITGRDMGDYMEFTIADNGRGIDPETLKRLQDSICSIGDEIHPRHESFGLYSVNRRIRLLYGEPYGLTVDSRLGEYTIVRMTLPKSTNNGGIS